MSDSSPGEPRQATPMPGTPEHFARLVPDEPAVFDGERILTWRELDELANRLARGLERLGIAAGDRVAVRTLTRWEWFPVNLALAKLGAVHVAVNWKLTPPETRYILADSGTKIVIFDDESPARVWAQWQGLGLAAGIAVSPLERDAAAEASLYSLNELWAQPAETTYLSQRPAPLVLYTSGTTGRPKGAVPDPAKLAARGKEVEEYLASVGASVPQSDRPRVLMALPMHHGAGPAGSLGALRRGGRLVLMRRYDPVEALRLVSEHRITHWTAVPTMLHRIRALPPETVAAFDTSSLETLSTGAAPVPFALKQWVVETFGDDCLYEGYGATEVGMVTFMRPEDQLRKPGSSGKPYRHVEIKILDEEGRELGAGESGEIWVKTPVAIDRYLNRDPLGEDTLSPDGFFRIGDVGHLDEEGYLFITDRKKDMIVAGGVNIYPAEIEAVLVKHPAIIDAAVIGVPNDDLGEEVLAFCEVARGATPDTDEILELCRRELARYKLPRRFELVEELPRNPMGKVLKTELRAPYWKDRERKV